MLTKIEGTKFFIWLINPVEKEPPEVKVALRLSLGFKSYSLYDAEKGKAMGEVKDNEWINLGLHLYRLIEVKAR